MFFSRTQQFSYFLINLHIISSVSLDSSSALISDLCTKSLVKTMSTYILYFLFRSWYWGSYLDGYGRKIFRVSLWQCNVFTSYLNALIFCIFCRELKFVQHPLLTLITMKKYYSTFFMSPNYRYHHLYFLTRFSLIFASF